MIYVYETERLPDIKNRIVASKGHGEGGEKEWSLGADRCNLTEWINNRGPIKP